MAARHPDATPQRMSPPLRQPALHIRSYRGLSAPHDHDFAQLVLPVTGALDLDIAGHAGSLDVAHAGFVPRGLPHATRAHHANRVLVLDLSADTDTDDTARTLAPALAALAERPFVQLSAPAHRLVDFMALLVEQGQAAAPAVQLWVPLLLDTLLLQPARPASRLMALRAQVQAALERPWTVAQMAQQAAISPSRLHELFQLELQTTPRAWLAGLRLARACELLAATRMPIAEVAARSGFADQSALSHAMRRARGQTPAAWRKLQQAGGTTTAGESGTKLP